MTASPSRLIVALDVPERDRALRLAKDLAGEVAMVKLGLEAFVAHGPSFVRELRKSGVEVFLDLKLHDIPRTVEAASAGVADLDVRLLTVHAQGGADMVQAARTALPPTTLVIAVTVLTSLDAITMAKIGFAGTPANVAKRLGDLAIGAGADGLVCSAHELKELASLSGIRVVPGIRPSGSAVGDQKRVATPASAVSDGATYLVVGRPILEAADPVAAAKSINAEANSVA